MPVIKIICTENYRNFNVDITLKDFEHRGLECAAFVKDCLNRYPILEAVILALKEMLRYAQLNNPYKGGLSSYSIILMLLFALQNS